MNKREALNFFNLGKDFSATELRDSYRRATKKHHPDMGGDAEMFILSKKAFDLLSGQHTAVASTIRVTLEELFFGCTKTLEDGDLVIPEKCILGTIIQGYEIRLKLDGDFSIDYAGNITQTLKVSPFKMIRGGWLNVDLFDRQHGKIYLPPCTSGGIFKLADRGVYVTSNTRSGYFFKLTPDIKPINQYSEEDTEWLKTSLSSTLTN